MTKRGREILKDWAIRLTLGVLFAGLMAWLLALTGIESETDWLLLWLFTGIAFLLGVTYGGQSLMTRRKA